MERKDNFFANSWRPVDPSKAKEQLAVLSNENSNEKDILETLDYFVRFFDQLFDAEEILPDSQNTTAEIILATKLIFERKEKNCEKIRSAAIRVLGNSCRSDFDFRIYHDSGVFDVLISLAKNLSSLQPEDQGLPTMGLETLFQGLVNNPDTLENGIFANLLTLLPEKLDSSVGSSTITFFVGCWGQLLESQAEKAEEIAKRIINYLLFEDGAIQHEDLLSTLLSFAMYYLEQSEVADVVAILKRLLYIRKAVEARSEFIASMFPGLFQSILENCTEEEKTEEFNTVAMEILEDGANLLQNDNTFHEDIFQYLFICASQSEGLTQFFLENETIVNTLKKWLVCTEIASYHRTGHLLLPCLELCQEPSGVRWLLKQNLLEPMFAIMRDPIMIEAIAESEQLLEAFEGLLKTGSSLDCDNETFYNPVAVEAASWVQVLDDYIAKDYFVAKRIKEEYFCGSWENFLASIRGLKTKKAR